MAEHRIVSLIASATEMVAALGFEEQLVGRSHECDFPPSVERLPVCSAAKVDVRRDVKTVAAALDAPDRGVDLVARLTARLDAIRAAAAARPARRSPASSGSIR